VIRIEAARFEDIPIVAAAVGDYDLSELRRFWAMTPEDAMRIGITYGTHCWTVWADSDPLGMFGVREQALVIPSAELWMVCTRHIERHKIGFARVSKQIRDQLLARYETLTNLLDCGRPEVTRWAHWLGAEIEDGTLPRFWVRA
jgi:hypothetical protein